MAKNQHTFAKRQREIEKKRKADEKRARRLSKGQVPQDDSDLESPPSIAE
jgi:hypothetical protein